MITIKDKHGREWSIIRKETIGLIEHYENGSGSCITKYGYAITINSTEKNKLMKWLGEKK